LSFRD